MVLCGNKDVGELSAGHISVIGGSEDLEVGSRFR